MTMKISDRILNKPIIIAHETFRLTPNQLSVIGFGVGLLAAGMVAVGQLQIGLVTLAISQILDGLDGGIARRYGLSSARGKTLDSVFDRLSELAIFLALAVAGLASYRMAALAFVAVLLVTAVEPYSRFDPGFKRFMVYFGYLATVFFHVNGFEIALHLVFWANLGSCAVGTIIADYRLQRDIDEQELARRRAEHALGKSPLPDDPPSLLSRLFA